MGKRLGIAGAVIAVMALVVGAVSPALGSSGQQAASTASGHANNRQTIRVLAVFTEFDPNIDVGAPGFSLGDEVVFSGNLLRNGEQVGRIGVVCTFVSTANAARVEASALRPQSSPRDRSPPKARSSTGRCTSCCRSPVARVGIRAPAAKWSPATSRRRPSPRSS